MSKSQSILQAENLFFSYGEQTILENISCTFSGSEFVLIAGPNGAGKSTLLKLLGGILEQRAGTVLLNGERLNQLNRRRISRQIAYLPQNMEFPLHLLVRDFLYFARYPHRNFWHGFSNEDIRAVAEAAKSFNLEDFLHKSILEISGGEQRRVLLAGLAARRADCYLLDEPLNNLDPHSALQVALFLKQLKNQGKTILVVSHDFNFLWNLADRLLLIKNGRIVYDGQRRFIKELFWKVFDAEFKIIRENEQEFLIVDV